MTGRWALSSSPPAAGRVGLNKLFSLVWELVRQQNYQTYSFDFFCLQRHIITHLSLFDVLRKERTFDGIFNANSAGSTLRRRHIGVLRGRHQMAA